MHEIDDWHFSIDVWIECGWKKKIETIRADQPNKYRKLKYSNWLKFTIWLHSIQMITFDRELFKVRKREWKNEWKKTNPCPKAIFSMEIFNLNANNGENDKNVQNDFSNRVGGAKKNFLNWWIPYNEIAGR